MKNLIIACCLMLAASTAMAERQLMDRIIAVVNDDVILYSELTERIDEIRARYANNPGVLPDDESLAEQILDVLILERVQLQRARSADISVTDAELNQALTDIARRQNMSLSEFRSALESDGLDYAAVRRQVRQDIQIRRAQERFVGRNIQVTDSEVRQYLQTQVSAELQEVEYQLLHVLIPADDSDAREQAQAISDRVNQQGEDFADAAGSRTVQDLGMRKPDDLPQLLQAPLEGLTVGNASAPFESQNGWHVVYMADQSGNATQQVTEYQARHILLNDSQGLTAEAAEQLIHELYRDITEGGADFAELAREYSVDGSGESGGNLGWNPPSVFVPEFANAIRNTPANTVSEPFESTFGWHIVEVTGQRDRDESFDNLRNQVRNILFEQKYSEALPRWQQEVKNNAYISLRIDLP